MARDPLMVMDYSCCTKEGRSKQSRSLWSCSLVLWRLLEGAWVWGFPHLISCLKYSGAELVGLVVFMTWSFVTSAAPVHYLAAPKTQQKSTDGSERFVVRDKMEKNMENILVCYTVWTRWLPLTCRFFGVGLPRKEQLGGIHDFRRLRTKRWNSCWCLDGPSYLCTFMVANLDM